MTANGEFGKFEDIPADSPFTGVERRSFDSSRATVTRYSFEPDASFPQHRHPQEQITLIEKGEVEFSVGGVPTRMRSGDWCVVPPQVEHSLTAEACGAVITAIIVPRREQAGAYTVIDD